MPEQGEIVLIPIPFTDLTSQKRRPVIVVSNDAYHRKTTDMVVVAMTSNPAVVACKKSIRIPRIEGLRGCESFAGRHGKPQQVGWAPPPL